MLVRILIFTANIQESNSDIFELFLNKLNDWIVTNDNFRENEVLIAIDN